MASFLPGMSITLCQIISGDTKQGQTVIMVLSIFQTLNHYALTLSTLSTFIGLFHSLFWIDLKLHARL